MRRNNAMTLLEILISTALFATMLVLVFEAMANMRGLASTVEDMDILEEQAARAKRAISRDFANSGWFYCLPGANGRKYYPQIHLSDPQTWQKTIAPEPAFEIPLFNSTTAAIEDTLFTASVSLNRASVLGDAIVFTRLQPEGQPHTNTPAAQGAAIVDMRTARPMAMDQFAHARPVQGLVINPGESDQPDLSSVVWETTPAVLVATPAGIQVGDLYDDKKIRLFCYRVVPDPTTGRGQLIRYYSNPDSGDRNTDAAWQIDEVIATDVVGMRIYSFEMASWHSGTNTERNFTTNDAAGLTNNQIRFFIDFARNLGQVDADTAIDVSDRGGTSRSSNSQRASTVKTLEFTIGLRSITNALDQ